MKRTCFIGRVAIYGKHLDQGDQRLLYGIIGVNRREMRTHVRFHHWTVPGDKFTPTGMLGVFSQIAQKRSRSFWYLSHI